LVPKTPKSKVLEKVPKRVATQTTCDIATSQYLG
jgi:hypothetical protein